MKCIDAHAHIAEQICGFGFEGELRGIGNGMAKYSSGRSFRIIPEELGDKSFSAETLIKIMNDNDVEKAVLLQGNYLGFQNLYTYDSYIKYPDRICPAASYNPFAKGADGVRDYLFGELCIKVMKIEASIGSGLFALCDFNYDGEVMKGVCKYAEKHNIIIVIDIGKAHSVSWKIDELRRLITAFPSVKFVICHLFAFSGGFTDELKTTLELFAFDNVWFDLASLHNNIKNGDDKLITAASYARIATDILGDDRLMWGSDAPSGIVNIPYCESLRYLADSKLFNEIEINKIMYQNAYGLFFKKA